MRSAPRRCWARALVSFVVTGLIVVGVLLLLPLAAFYGRTEAVIIVMMATTVLLLYQVLVGQFLTTRLTRRKVLVYGTGARALAVGETGEAPVFQRRAGGLLRQPQRARAPGLGLGDAGARARR